MKQNFPLFTLVSCRLAPNAVIAIFVGKKQPSIVLQGLKIKIQIVLQIGMIRSSGCQSTDANKVKGRNSKKNTVYIDFG